jgi:hypothetical protein
LYVEDEEDDKVGVFQDGPYFGHFQAVEGPSRNQKSEVVLTLQRR